MSPFQRAAALAEAALSTMKHRPTKPVASRTALRALKQAAAAPDPSPATQPTANPPPTAFSGDKIAALASLEKKVAACTRCPHLASSRTQTVFGVGNPDARLMFVGEAPGADEDAQGEPFVGKAGELLTKMIVAMGLDRQSVYIGNVLKCRPDMPPGSSGNRKPRRDEMETCLPYLREQIAIIGPEVLVALGATAMEGLTGRTDPMGSLRGRWHEFAGIPLMATYHPAYLLRNQSLSERRKVWEDLLMVLERLRMPISAKQRSFFLPK